jgi:hypothetical protein
MTLEQQWARELSARGMFEHKTRGSCSSSAIYLNGCLRALGLPARTVLCIPLVDASDEQELRMLRVGLQHRSLRREVTAAAQRLRGTWASHTFNEVFVGGRWRRLNYDRLGQDIRDPAMFGLMIHVATFSDWADARMPETIGRRQKGGAVDDVFGGRNPYSTIALRDEFGPHCTLENPPPAAIEARITALWWHDAEDLRADVREWCARNGVFGLIARVEGIAGPGELEEFLGLADPGVLLHADGKPTLGTGFDRGNWWRDAERGYALLVVPFDQRDFVAGMPYRFEPRNGGEVRWTVAEGLEVPSR